LLSFDPKERTERENYKLLTGTIVPRPIAFVTSVAKDGTVNGAPFSYFNIVSSNPPMISIAIQRNAGVVKDTARNIIENKAFVVHVVDEDNVEKINETAASLPSNESEIELAGLTLIASENISAPGIEEAKVRFECTLEHSVELGEGDSIGTDFIIGKIVKYHIDESIYMDGKIDHKTLSAMSRLAGPNYAKIGEVISLKRPK